MTSIAPSPSYSDISNELEKAIATVDEKKKVLDTTTEALKKSTTDYNEAIEKAHYLKDQLVNLLTEKLPNTGSQTRTR
jgi:hypothetical protein